ncbi:MAG: metal-dependent hydrolase [Promethearchaeota archaeon]
MNTNTHYAMGLIIASSLHFWYTLNLGEYLFIVFCAFIADIDYFFRKFAKDENHRNFITHTIYPAIILIVLSPILDYFFHTPFLFITNFVVIAVGGFAYLSHILLDLLDWGLNPFYTKHTIGLYLVLSQHEKNLAHPKTIIEREKKKDQYFFVKRYYNTPLIVSIDFIISVIGFFFVFSFNPQFWYVPIGLLVLVEYHLYLKRKAEKNI